MKMNKHTKILFGVLTLLVLALTFSEVKSILDSSLISAETTEVKEKINIGPYTVENDQSEYEKQLTTQITSAIASKKQNDVVKSVAQYFIADYFTLRDKQSNTDVGGLAFVFPKNKKAFKTNAINSYYMDFATFKDTYKQENLPLVTSVTAAKPKKVEGTSVKTSQSKKTKVAAIYDVDVSWKYEPNDVLATKNIVKKATLRFVRDAETKVWYVYDLMGRGQTTTYTQTYNAALY